MSTEEDAALTGDDRSSAVDEEFRSLMEGIRTSLPGVQVLFAFLLIAPFQGQFSELDDLGRAAFAVAFYAAGLASTLLIAPSVHQRVRAPHTGISRRSKRHLIWATWVTIVGTCCMAVAVLSTVFLVSSIVFDLPAAVFATVALGGALCWSWAYLPLVTFVRRA